jgi:hypothetical protein
VSVGTSLATLRTKQNIEPYIEPFCHSLVLNQIALSQIVAGPVVATSVQITLIICGTITFLVMFSHFFHRNDYSYRSNRLGDYQRLLAAIADIKCKPHDDRSWDRLASASHLVCLTAPAEVVQIVMSCCREMHETRGSPSPKSFTKLLMVLREDLGIPAVENPQMLEMDILPSKLLERAS